MSNKLSSIIKSSILLVALCATGGAWADLVAEWGPGDFPVSASGTAEVTDTQGGLTIGKNNYLNTSTADYIMIAPSSVGSGWPAIVSGSDLSDLTVVVAFSLNEGTTGSLLGFTTGRGVNTVYAYLDNGSMYAGWWNGNNDKYGNLNTTVAADGTIHYLAFAYSKSGGTEVYYNGVSKYANSGLRAGDSGNTSGNTTEITLGAQRGPTKIINGTKFHYVAVYNSKLGAADALSAYNQAHAAVLESAQTITVNADTSVSTIKAQFDSENYGAIAVSAADGVTITVDEAFGCIASVSSEGNVKLAAAEQPAASYFSGVDFSGVQGALLRSWLSSSIVGVNFNSSQGSDISGALVAADSWIHDNNSPNGTSTGMFSDGLSTLTWASANTWQYSGSTFLTGYLDDGANGGNGATIKLSNVPYATYDVIIYCATDSSGQFLAKTVNGTSYTWDSSSGAAVAGTAAWGTSPQTTAAYGTNALRVKNLTGPLTIYGTARNGTNRGGIAAFEIINTTHEATISSADEYTLADLFTSVEDSGHYVINVNESAALNIGSATTVGGVTFNVSADKTLTLTGSTLTATTINVNGDGMVAMTSSLLNGTVKGNGTLYYNGVRPTTTGTDVVLTDNDWRGTVRITYNYLNTATSTARQLFPQHWGSANSKIMWNGVAGYFGTSNQSLAGWVLEDLTVDATTYPALRKNDGGSSSQTTAPSLEGSGEFADASNPSERFHFATGANFTGKITITSGAGFGMNVQFGETAVAKVARTIHVLSGATVNVAAGKTWSAPGGIVVNGTLNVGAGSTIPAIVSGSSGVVQITSAGMATISGVKDNAISSSLVMVGGNIAVVDTGITELTIPAETGVTFFSMGNGKLDLSGCTSLTTLKLNLGSGTTFDLANVMLPASCTTVLVDVGSARTLTGYTISNLGTATLGFSATETKEEYANGTFSVSNVPSGANVSVARADGTTSNAIVTDGTARLADYGTVRISGAATDIDWDFTDGTDDALEQAPTGVSKNSDTTLTFYADADDSTYTGVYLKHHPYVENAATFIHNNSSAITVAAVGTMPSGSKDIFMNFGSAYANKYGLLLATTENTDEVLVAYNYGATVTPITTMTVPNAATARHVYIITKEDGDASTTFTVYLDGIKWKTVTTNFKIEFANANTGIQFGSDFGGNIRNAGYNAVSGDTGILNVLRVYGRILTPAEIAAYTTAYPYTSPNGSSARTFTTAAENWIDTTESSEVWSNSDDTKSGTPLTGAALNVTANVETEVTVNLASETTYEALTIGGAATTFVPGGNGGDVKVTGMTVIGTTVTNQYGAVDMSGGPMTITQDGDITFDYSAYDISTIYTTTDIPLTSDVDENSTKVHLVAPSAAYRTASLVYTSGHYAMRVTLDHEAGSDVYYTGGYWGTTESTFAVTNASGAATIVLPGDTVVIPAYHDGTSAYFGATLPANVSAIRVEKNFTFESGVDDTAILGGATVTVAEGCTLSFATSWHNLTLGSVTFDGDGIVSIPTLTRTASIAGAVSGTATITIGGTVTVPSTGSIANTVVGDGRIVFEGALPTSDTLLTSLQDENNWTGTVEIKDYEETTDSFGIINFGNYGNRESAIALNDVTSTIFTGNGKFPAYPDVTLKEIEICEGGWTDGSTGEFTIDPAYTANLTGNGTITVTTRSAGTVKFIGNHTFNGSVAFGANTGKQVAFMKTAGDTLPSVAAKTIVVAGRTNMSIASGKIWTADAIKLDGSLTVRTAEKATATSVTPTAYLDGASLTTTVDGEAGTTTYVTDEVTQISDNQATLGAVTVSEPLRMTGSGGAYMSSLTINDGMTLTYDPVITPIRVESAPVFNGTGKLKLAARYAGVTCGKFHLVTYPSSLSVSSDTLHDLVDATSFNNATYTVTEETVTVVNPVENTSLTAYTKTDYKQLVLKIGDYDTAAKPMTIAQFGDSITEGIFRNGYRGTPNYRIPLMQLLEAYGYKPEAKGYREVGSEDANGVKADDKYAWHTGISAQRIYTGGSIRAGFMESIEAHLEQVGVTDIITLKIGTNDAIGGESADNMFEGWSNLVWKIVRMRPTSKIVVCAPVKIRSGERNAPGLRTKIAEYVAKTAVQGGFPDGQVTMINGIEIVTDDADHYLTDNIHPNWNGHLQLANAWLPAVTNAFESMKVNDVIVHAADAYTAQPAVDSAEDVDDLADYRAGYVKLATFTNVFTKVSTWDEPPYTWVNDNFKNVEMSRVAYFVARKTTASPDTRYVWVDMDADATTGTTLAQFCVPTNASVNGVVNNLHIYSNSSAIENVAPNVSGVRGTLMLTEKGVSTTNGISTVLAPDGPYGFDWNDSIYAEGAWGVMNVARIFDGVTPTTHRKLLAAQMLFDFNGFNGSRQNALGIGNFAVHGPYLYGNGSVQNYNLNWTFTTDKDEMPTMDARALESGVIEIWGLVDAIPGDEGADAGYIDGTTAVITNTTSSVTVPAGATSVDLSFSTGDSIVLTSTSVNLTESGKVTVYATDATGAKTDTDISDAFKVTAGANNTYTVELDDTATVGGVSVTPEVDTAAETAPMAFDSTAPVFTIKTIPGLWYTVASGATLESLTNGTPEQADDSSRTLAAPDFEGTVQYYKVKVGPSKASVQ